LSPHDPRHDRALPDQPNLRFLKVEAKRRLSAGEFPTLHEAHLAIAREHGHPSWTSLKTAIDEAGTILPHVRWVINRHKTSDGVDWVRPTEEELNEHVTARFLEQIPADVLAKMLRSIAHSLREPLIVEASTEKALRAEIGGLRLEASAEEEASNRIKMLRLYPIAKRANDSRLGEQTNRTTGQAPAKAHKTADQAKGELRLPGLVLAGAGWTLCTGWRNLDTHEELTADHRFPAYGIAKVITATAIVLIVDDLDVRANTILRGTRLANDEITVRDLLTHTAGVRGPEVQFAPEAPEFVYEGRDTIPCGERRGELLPSNGGYAVLGKIVADVTGKPYPEATRNLILKPLGMHDTDFPTTWPGGAVITGYHLAENGTFEEAERHVSTMAAAGGVWTTAPDLVRFGRNWATLLPASKVEEALRPQAGAGSAKLGLGWLVNPGGDLYGHSGAGPGAGASLLIGLSTGEVTVTATNRQVPMEPVNARLRRPAD
jgi:CubicO group peptidase (beta-lactamase class C family)